MQACTTPPTAARALRRARDRPPAVTPSKHPEPCLSDDLVARVGIGRMERAGAHIAIEPFELVVARQCRGARDLQCEIHDPQCAIDRMLLCRKQMRDPRFVFGIARPPEWKSRKPLCAPAARAIQYRFAICYSVSAMCPPW